METQRTPNAEKKGSSGIGHIFSEWKLSRTTNSWFTIVQPTHPLEEGIPGGHSISAYIYGVGLQHKREHILQYVHFDIGIRPSLWIERDMSRDMIGKEDEGLQIYEAARKLDEEAYDLLTGTTQLRAVTRTTGK